MGATERARSTGSSASFGAEVKIQYDAAPHPAARQGLAVPPRDRLRHGVRRLVQPLARRAARRRGVERPAVPGRDPGAARQVHGHLRHLLERPELRDLRPGRDRDRLDDALAEASGRTTARPGDHLACPASRSGRSPTSRRCSTRSRSSATCTAATATSSSPPPAPARPSSPRWTTAALCGPTPATGRRCSSSRTARRSSSSPCAPTARCSPTPLRRAVRRRRAPGALAARLRQRSVAAARTASPTSRPTPSTSWSSTSSITPRRATYRRLLDHLTPRELLGLTATPERADGLDVRAVLRRPHRRRAAAVGRPRRGPAVPVPLLRGRRRHRPARASAGARGRYDDASCRTSTPATTPAPRSSSSNCATRSSTRARCARSASA